MSLQRTAPLVLPALTSVALAAAAVGASPASATTTPDHRTTMSTKHVLLLSVDGMHQSDLAWYVRNHPHSALAALVGSGTSYANARTPFPSDFFPGMVGQVTGGDPRTTGIYYDVSYNHAMLPAGTTQCAGAKSGTDVNFDETIDKDFTKLDAGQGLSGLPGSILSMTGKPTSLLDATQLPVDPKTCRPVYPNNYLKVNTVFGVLHTAGRYTAWSDKHPAYQILNGPGSTDKINDLFTPEINSDHGTGDWTTDNAATQQYDTYKVNAVINEIDGRDHSGKTKAPVPALFGMNFQSVSTAQKLPTSDGMAGGYLPGSRTPGPLLTKALDYVNSQVGRLVARLKADHLAGSTTIILSAKHGQSPVDPSQLTRIDDGPIIDGINAAWAAKHPSNKKLVVQAMDDDGMLLWTSDRSPAATNFVRDYLRSHPATGNTMSSGSRTLAASGLKQVYAVRAAARFMGLSASDARTPDVIGISQQGVVYTGKKKKIAEHGGDAFDDRAVPLVVASAAESGRGHTVGGRVATTQIAPTILRLLGLNPNALQAVRIQHTRVLPGLSRRD